ncbi:hypothetical protein [Nocardioides yefusunii]|uniref:Uncharacterized protein n=1 Tax=Nocardioides yefusunii TaxID=2500546 RepID=A0ABW1QYF3_9ACTN|nr:hypothetical protein [Nocardioides yefusunii]
MRHHRDLLAQHGWCYPYAGNGGHFLAALEMTGKAARWGRTAEQVEGRFARLLEVGRAHGGDVVISHEIFGQARPEQVARVVELADDFELHVVITVRDLGRVIPAAWQEWVKNGKRGTFDDFVELKASRLPERGTGELFWRLQNLAEIMDRWLAHVPADQVHVVPSPPAGAPDDALWRRFGDAIALTESVLDLFDVGAVPRANESIGAAQVTVLRKVNAALAGRLVEPHGDAIRKHWFAQQVLSRTSSFKAQAPPDVVEMFAPVSQSWVDHVRACGVRVHGDLEDVLPVRGAVASRHPDSATDAEQLDGLPEALAETLVRVMELRQRVAELEAELAARPNGRAIADKMLRPLRKGLRLQR